MFSEFVALLFFSKDYAHRAHLNTSVFSAHLALDEFYKTMPELIDRLVEMYQGRHGRMIIPTVNSEIEVDVATPIPILTQHLAIIEATRDQVLGNDRPLQNVVDEICGLYLTTLYKLKTFA